MNELNDPQGKAQPKNNSHSPFMYTVKAVTVEGCDCEDCQAGRHIYSLYRWKENTWKWVGTSLQSYLSPEQAKAKHRWCIDFEPGAIWEDGMPVVEPPREDDARLEDGRAVEMVPLDTDALRKSCDTMIRHWVPPE